MTRTRLGLTQLFAAVGGPDIALAALVRLRWLAVVGQVAATLAAQWLLNLHLPLGAIGAIIAVTFLSNVLLVGWMRMSVRGLDAAAPAPGRLRAGWLVPVVLLLDILLLTGLLYLTGGSDNPFAALYLVNLVISVIVLGSGWTWIFVAVVAGCYGVVLVWHMELKGSTPPPWAMESGRWSGLVLVSVLMAVFVGRIVRQLRQRELELVEARQRAGRNEHLAALTTLAAGAAHELNTPLGTIAVVAKELEKGCGEATEYDTIRDDAQLIRREVERCRQILSGMRVDLGEEVLQLRPIRIADLVQRLREALQERQAGRLVVRQCVEVVQGPPRTLEQTVLVLLRNAFDASDESSPVELSIERHDGHVRFEIRDRGCGMSDEQLRRLGQPFFTTKEPGKGMGLGLFLVRLVAERLGADFSVESRIGEGTRVIFDLPEAGEARDVE